MNRQAVLVIGLGISGTAAVAFLIEKGLRVLGYDDRSMEMPFDIEAFSLDQSLEDIAYVVLSPGVSPSHPLCIRIMQRGIPLIGEMELAARHISVPCIGITGTNGKTTGAELISHVLRSKGYSLQTVGNIGKPLTTVLSEKLDLCVVELSSYQIDTLQTPFLTQAIICNITPDHLDRYPTLTDYAHSKMSIAQYVTKRGKCYIDAETR